MDKAALLIILLVSVLIPALFFSGYRNHQGQDDSAYVGLAKSMLAGNYSLTANPYGYGIGFVFLTAVGEAGNFPVLSSWVAYALLGIVSFLLCRRYFSEKLSLLSTLSLQLSFFVFPYASRVLPDLWSGVLVGLALLLASYETRRGNFLAGIALASLVFIKIGSFSLVAIFAIAYLVSWNRRLFPYLALGLCLPVLAYSGIAFLYHTNILFLLDSYSANQVSLSQATLVSNIATVGYFFAGYLPSSFYVNIFPLGLFFILGVIGALASLISGRKKFYALFLLLGISYLFLGTESFTHYVSIVVSSRYFAWYAPALGLMMCFLLERLDIKRDWHYMAILLMVFLTNFPMILLLRAV